MSLQKQVNLYPDIAIEGSLYRNPVEATAGLAGVDTTVGRGVFSSVNSTGILADIVSNIKGAAGIFTGIAYRANLAPNFDITSTESMIVPKGFNVSILTLGSVWVNNTVSAAQMGYFVFVKDTDGTIQCQETNAPLAGFSLTTFKVIGMKANGAVDTLILISNTQGINATA